MQHVPKSNLHRFCPKHTALGLGIVWGACILITGWVSMTGWGCRFVDVMGSIYTGYRPSFIGGVVGGIWGFFYGAIIGLVFAWVYNKLCRA